MMFLMGNSRLKGTHSKSKFFDLTKSRNHVLRCPIYRNERKQHAGMKNLKLSLQVKKSYLRIIKNRVFKRSWKAI